MGDRNILEFGFFIPEETQDTQFISKYSKNYHVEQELHVFFFFFLPEMIAEIIGRSHRVDFMPLKGNYPNRSKKKSDCSQR